MRTQRIIVDANVISLLADEKTGKKHLKQQEFYLSRASNCVWHVTKEIMDELDLMLVREGKRALHAKCLDLLEEEKAIRLPPTNLEPILQRDDLKQALKDHNKTRSDRNDKKNIARSLLEDCQFFCHDDLLCKRAKTISGVKLVSWYLRPQKGRKNIKRDKRDNKVDW